MRNQVPTSPKLGGLPSPLTEGGSKSWPKTAAEPVQVRHCRGERVGVGGGDCVVFASPIMALRLGFFIDQIICNMYGTGWKPAKFWVLGILVNID